MLAICGVIAVFSPAPAHAAGWSDLYIVNNTGGRDLDYTFSMNGQWPANPNDLGGPGHLQPGVNQTTVCPGANSQTVPLIVVIFYHYEEHAHAMYISGSSCRLCRNRPTAGSTTAR